MAMSINVQSFYQYGVQPVPQGRTRFRQGVSTFLETVRKPRNLTKNDYFRNCFCVVGAKNMKTIVFPKENLVF